MSSKIFTLVAQQIHWITLVQHSVHNSLMYDTLQAVASIFTTRLDIACYLIAISVTGILVLELVEFFKNKRKYSHIPGPPGTHLILGNGKQIDQIRKNAYKDREIFFEAKKKGVVSVINRARPFQGTELDWTHLYTNWGKIYGDIFKVRIKNRYLVIVHNPDIGKNMLVQGQNFYKNDHIFQRPLHNYTVYPFNNKSEPKNYEFDNIFGASLQTSRGDQWVWRRKLLSSHFTARNLFAKEHVVECIYQYTSEMCDSLETLLETSEDGSALIFLDDKIYYLVLRLICKFLFGTDNGMGEGDFNNLTEWLKNLVDEFVHRPVFYPEWFNSKSKMSYEARENIKQLVFNQVKRIKIHLENRAEEMQDFGLIYQMLADAKYSMNDIATENKRYNDQLYEQFNELYERHSHLSTVQSRRDHFQELSQNELINNCIKESLRLFPIAWAVAVVNRKETKLGDFTIPECTPIVIHLRLLNRNAEHYPNPDAFIPERFASKQTGADDEEFDKGTATVTQLFSFSLGAHTCIGKFLALYEVRVIISELLRRFQFQSMGEKYSTRMYSTLHPADALPMRISKRK